MLCKLCGTTYTSSECSKCGLRPGESSVVTRLDFGKHKGSSVQEVYKVSPSYLQWMISHKVGTPAQRAKARLLFAENKPTTQVKPSQSSETKKADFDYKYDYMQGPPDLMDLINYQTRVVEVSRQPLSPTRPDFILPNKPANPVFSQPSQSSLPSNKAVILPIAPLPALPQATEATKTKISIRKLVFKLFVAFVMVGVIIGIIIGLAKTNSTVDPAYSNKSRVVVTSSATSKATPTSRPAPANIPPTAVSGDWQFENVDTVPAYIPPTAVARPTPTPTPSPQQLSAEGKLTYHASGCDIKGDRNFKTEEPIYHVPGQKYYDATVINPNYGERWFCTEQDAINNGWRKSEV